MSSRDDHVVILSADRKSNFLYHYTHFSPATPASAKCSELAAGSGRGLISPTPEELLTASKGTAKGPGTQASFSLVTVNCL